MRGVRIAARVASVWHRNQIEVVERQSRALPSEGEGEKKEEKKREVVI